MKKRNQKGLGLVGFLLLITLVSFFAKIGVVVGPIYLKNYSVVKIIKGIADDPDSRNLSVAQVNSMILNRLEINNISSISKKHFRVKKGDRGYLVSVKYEEREHLLFNVDVVLSFEEVIEVVTW